MTPSTRLHRRPPAPHAEEMHQTRPGVHEGRVLLTWLWTCAVLPGGCLAVLDPSLSHCTGVGPLKRPRGSGGLGEGRGWERGGEGGRREGRGGEGWARGGEGRGERGGRFCPDVQVPLLHTPPAAAALTWVWETGEWRGQVCPGTVESVFLLCQSLSSRVPMRQDLS